MDLTYPRCFMVPESKGHWATAHNLALTEPSGPDERRTVKLLKIVSEFALDFNGDSFGGPEVLTPLIEATRNYLNFPLGRIDAGSIDHALTGMLLGAGLEAT